jgi:hypothetical protein
MKCIGPRAAEAATPRLLPRRRPSRTLNAAVPGQSRNPQSSTRLRQRTPRCDPPSGTPKTEVIEARGDGKSRARRPGGSLALLNARSSCGSPTSIASSKDLLYRKTGSRRASLLPRSDFPFGLADSRERQHQDQTRVGDNPLLLLGFRARSPRRPKSRPSAALIRPEQPRGRGVRWSPVNTRSGGLGCAVLRCDRLPVRVGPRVGRCGGGCSGVDCGVALLRWGRERGVAMSCVSTSSAVGCRRARRTGARWAD